MGEEDGTERCGSRAAPTMDSLQGQPRHQQLQQRHKLDVYNEVLRRVKEAGRPEALLPSFEDGLWNHFNRLPARYAMDVNIERTEDVLMHQHLLEAAQDPAKRPAFMVRLIQVAPSFDVNPTNSSDSSIAGEEAHSTSTYFTGPSVRPSTFDSSSNLESLALEASRHPVRDGDSCANAFRLIPRPMHEITISTDDRPKILSLLTSLLSGLGLNIQEAHAFSTNDGYSLDVFVVDGWDREETEELTDSLRKEIENMENKTFSKTQSWTPQRENAQSPEVATSDHVRIPTDGKDVWEIDFRQLKFGNKVASGTYGDLYRGTYCSQDVAIKVLKPDHISADMQREFSQEVYIMRFITQRWLCNVTMYIVHSCIVMKWTCLAFRMPSKFPPPLFYYVIHWLNSRVYNIDLQIYTSCILVPI